MKNEKIRHILESEISRLRALKKPLDKKDFKKYCNCLKSLYTLERNTAIKQKEIYSCAYGDMAQFIREFIRHTSPLTRRSGKEIRFYAVRHSRTFVLFSPRLTEIALSSIFLDFLHLTDTINVLIFSTKSCVTIRVYGDFFQNSKYFTDCARHIAALHGGRCFVGFYSNRKEIILTFPFFPCFQPIKLVPCSTELCRLCHI